MQMVVKNALQQSFTGDDNTDGKEQSWHDDSLPGLFDQQFGVAIAMHDIESGAIAVQPGCFPPEGFHHQLAREMAADGSTSDEEKTEKLAAAAQAEWDANELPCYTSAGFAPE